ncbi:hypothetical protein SLS62_008567 [Diatrype stigma]|uniref:Cystathionine gamma-synthase n=1 Tax=Diatrype stigma TaxID=117547 RepID=A0AAN9UJY0_9PEZI
MAGQQGENSGGDIVQGTAHQKPLHGDGAAAGADDAANNAAAAALDPTTLPASLQHLSLSARTVHADDYLNSHQSVAPPMHVSTTFRYNRDPDLLAPWLNINTNNPHDSHVYSRDSAPNTTRLEAVLTSILGGSALTYSSGLASFHALLAFLNPRRVAIGEGYHGCHGVLKLMARLTGLTIVDLDCPDSVLGPGDLIHVETPLNPTGEARDLEHYAAKARRSGAYLSVDATFAPPPLLDPFRWGADVVMHSGTKYFGGHSDLLCGVLAVAPRHAFGGGGGDGEGEGESKGSGSGKGEDKTKGWIPRLRDERLVLGSVMGSFEGWLGVRSLRTLELRVRRQSADAEKLVRWLADGVAAAAAGSTSDPSSPPSTTSIAGRVVASVQHASLQAEASEADSWLRRQMPQGYGAVFSMLCRDEQMARRLPSKLHLFHHATSLGGVESLVEWRAMTDRSVDRRLLRVSVGVEGWEDLRDDLLQGFGALLAERADRAKLSGSDVGGSQQVMM